MCFACIGKSLVKCLLYEAFSWSSEKTNDLRFKMYLAQIVYSIARNTVLFP